MPRIPKRLPSRPTVPTPPPFTMAKSSTPPPKAQDSSRNNPPVRSSRSRQPKATSSIPTAAPALHTGCSKKAAAGSRLTAP